jgi:hypothetical protein
LGSEPLGTGHNVRSYKDAKNTPSDLSKDKSHASDEIIKKMIDIWTAIVQEGRGQIELTGKLTAFLKKALTDKFDSCLQKWKAYCISIARSRFLMGERTPFKATLDWALKFDIIVKILSGDCYGIGDRSRKLTPEELEEKEKQLEEQKKAKELEQQRSFQALEEEIKSNSHEPDSVKNFRIKWLNIFGEINYRELLADCEMSLGNGETDLMIQPQERIIAIRLEGHWKPELLSDQAFRRVQIYHHTDLMGKPIIFDRWLGGIEDVIEQEKEKHTASAADFDEPIDESQNTESKVDPRTNQLHASLKTKIPAKEYPAWLDEIKVQTIKPDGTLVVHFRDQLMADYARKRFFQEILESAAGLWGEVTDLMIYEGSGKLPSHEEHESLEFDERTLREQAIQSLMGEGFAGAGKGRVLLNDGIPY